MANKVHVNKLREGVEAWNSWRAQNPEIEPDLEYSDFTKEMVVNCVLWEFDDQAGEYFVNLNDVNLENANLVGVKLSGVVLGNANLKRANLRYADLKDAVMSGAQLNGANLFVAKAQKASLGSASLEHCNLSSSDLHGAYLSKANLRMANLSAANLSQANLWDADLRGALLNRVNLEGAHVSGVKFLRSSLQLAYQGIRVDTCHGSQVFKSFARDQDYIEELRNSGRKGNMIFWIWWSLADCGRSIARWAAWSFFLAILFAAIYYVLGPSHISVDKLPFSFASMAYYSVVTFTTLGFGDIKPASEAGALVVTMEVITGYMMLGGLISIMATKVARRS